MKHPRYRLQKHTPMPEASRAAQFSAFAALTGYDEEIEETARLTDARDALTADDLAELNSAFCRLLALAPEQPAVTVVYFRPDSRKSGGAYQLYSGHFRHYDAERRVLIFTDRTEIPAEQVTSIMLQGETR